MVLLAFQCFTKFEFEQILKLTKQQLEDILCPPFGGGGYIKVKRISVIVYRFAFVATKSDNTFKSLLSRRFKKMEHTEHKSQPGIELICVN